MTAANEALSTETPATVTFDTLKAAQELRKTGFEDRQAEAIVSTISKANEQNCGYQSGPAITKRCDKGRYRSDGS